MPALLTKSRPIGRAIIPVGLALLMTFSCGPKQGQHITILHTNDMHGHFVPEPASWRDDKAMVGGMEAIDYYVHQARSQGGNSLLLDAGDFMTGNLICDKEYNGAYGGALVEMMNMIGYDCAVFGNHEFDKPADNLRKLIALADYPVVCANFVDSLGQDFSESKFHIFNFGGLRVGVIGITYYPMAGMAKPSNLMGFDSTEPAKAVNDVAQVIDPETDLIIVLSHLGLDNDREMAKHIKNVDLIVGGHSHTLMKQPEKVNSVLIVQAGSYTHDLGKLDLVVAGDTIQSYADTVIETLAQGITAQPRLTALVDSFATVIDNEYNVVIGDLKTDRHSEHQAESNIGNWLTDIMRDYTGADVAFINSGGIRKNLMPGPITLKDINEMLPFQNYVETFECTGDQLMKIIQENANAQGLRTHGILQVSGIKYGWHKNGDKVEVVKALVGGKKIDKNKTYKIASIDYVNGNADQYYTITPSNLHNTGMLLSDVAIAAVKKAGTIDLHKESRITEVN